MPSAGTEHPGSLQRMAVARADGYRLTARKGPSEVIWHVMPSTERRKRAEVAERTPLVATGMEAGP